MKITLKKVIKSPVFRKIAFILGLMAVLFFGLIISFNITYSQKIYPKTFIGGINVGNKTQAEAQSLLQNVMIANKDKKVVLLFEKQNWVVKTSDIDLVFNPEVSAQEAWNVGRHGPLNSILKEQIKSIFSQNRLPARYDYSNQKLIEVISNIAQAVDEPEKNATIKISDNLAVIEPEQIGRRVNQEDCQKITKDLFGELTLESNHYLSAEVSMPKITQEKIAGLLEKTNKILQNEIVLNSERKNFTLSPNNYSSWLEFLPDKKERQLEISVNQEKLSNYVTEIGKEIFQETKDAKFEMQDNKAVAFQSSQVGYELEKESAEKLIREAILDTRTKLELPVKTNEPNISSNAGTVQGIKELVGEGTTSWRGSPKNRIHNLTLGSKNISGKIVKPGEEFSTIKSIGPIDAEHGFLPELVIKNGTQVVPDIGGGLCQVSTTLFRAVLNTGLKVTARSNHSFRVSYYEPPVGMDATIYDPAPDFKFVNNMDTPVLVWAVASDNGLTFKIFGTKDGRKTEVSDPVTYNYVDPPGPIYTETSTMEKGAIRQVERATKGVTARFTYKVTDKSGKVLEDDTFISKYIPVPDTFLYGPGTEIPKAE